MSDSFSSILPSQEPDIKVRIHTDGAPILVPRGEYSICPEGDKVRYTPCNGLSSIVVENLLIGLGFHWQRTIHGIFNGSMEVSRIPDGWQTLNILPVEQYLQSVIGSEMNPDAPLEFLKAHAVISRGWALSRIIGHSGGEESGKSYSKDRIITWEDAADHHGFHVCNDDHCQRYQGISGNEAVIRAVNDTRGMVLTDRNGNPADTRFSKSCGGHTELFSSCWDDSDKEYLPAQPDPWCDLSDLSSEQRKKFINTVFKFYDRNPETLSEWSVEVDKEGIRKRLMDMFGVNIGEIIRLQAVRRGPSGRIIELEISGTGGSIHIGKELAIRRLLSDGCLYSSAFDIEDLGSIVRLTGHGWGHGVGLCQTGAAKMAQEGYTYTDILHYYYPSTSITKLYD